MIKTVKELERITNILKRNFDKLYRYKITEVLSENGLVVLGYQGGCLTNDADTHLKIQYAKPFVYENGIVKLAKLTKDEIKGLKDLLVELTDERLESIIQGKIKEAEDDKKQNKMMVENFLKEVYETIKDVAETKFVLPFSFDNALGEIKYSDSIIVFSHKSFGLFRYWLNKSINDFEENDYVFVKGYGETLLKVLSENI